jgi:hypothetical protein
MLVEYFLFWPAIIATTKAILFFPGKDRKAGNIMYANNVNSKKTNERQVHIINDVPNIFCNKLESAFFDLKSNLYLLAINLIYCRMQTRFFYRYIYLISTNRVSFKEIYPIV